MELILERTFTLTPEDTAKNFALPFEVVQNYKSLRITHEYTPKVLEDAVVQQEIVGVAVEQYAIPRDLHQKFYNAKLTNLVTTTLLSPDGYIGAAHRPANLQVHTISPEGSSVGFVATPITKGVWELVMNVHCVITKTCTSSIKIEGIVEVES